MLTEETKWLAVTHKSFDHGRRGFNDRLAYLGMSSNEVRWGAKGGWGYLGVVVIGNREAHRRAPDDARSARVGNQGRLQSGRRSAREGTIPASCDGRG